MSESNAASAAIAELVSEAREEAEGRAGDFAYRESGGWESVANNVDFWYEWHWDEVKEELAGQAEERSLRWETVETVVQAAFKETFRKSFG
ncbi:hypothetical protein ABZ622_28135 [Streptomyces sp. NPDC007164]|uniref:hypothetical protein n=1 Tax=Streptomyces sp. NPDC007164 TaxID=3156918 RepID=UPI0033ED3942